ncbi:hypothetical protein Fcan01_03775 [Folsomia candida]|uniref:Uncharacterized protein n=1 Tax=Folsomia candida TaxID=158441 RepID=A0A226EW25_FOLCA|nr:hypothetical protein Fcan01_03775 [Folsomia candida]
MSLNSDKPSTSSAITTPPSKKKKLNINQTVLVSGESSTIEQLYVKREDGTFEALERCSPIQEEVASTRFQWETNAEVGEDEKWTPPTPRSQVALVFDALKTYLKWAGADKNMKSSPEMKNSSVTLQDILKSTKAPHKFMAFTNYEQQHVRTNDDGQSLPSPWVLVTPRPWVTMGQKQSTEFQDSVRVAISILFSLVNSQQSDPEKHYNLIADQVFVRNTNWRLVKILLEHFGVGIEFTGDSELGVGTESPLMKGIVLDRSAGKSWIYMKMGTIGRIHIGIRTQKKNSSAKTIAGYHNTDLDGPAIFQCQDDRLDKKNETEMMEAVGQVAVCFCEMLGGEIDGAPIRCDFQKIENKSGWKERHIEMLIKLVGFFSSRLIKIDIPDNIDFNVFDWLPVRDYLRPPFFK